MDTRLLVLYFVGAHDPDLVGRFKRLSDRFAPEDFHTLASFLEPFAQVVTTPHVLTEVSNWIGYLSEPAKTRCFALLAQAIPLMREHHTPAATLGTNAAFATFGITDTAIWDAAPGAYLVLTDDLPLYNFLGGHGVDVLNFNNIRWFA